MHPVSTADTSDGEPDRSAVLANRLTDRDVLQRDLVRERNSFSRHDTVHVRGTEQDVHLSGANVGKCDRHVILAVQKQRAPFRCHLSFSLSYCTGAITAPQSRRLPWGRIASSRAPSLIATCH